MHEAQVLCQVDPDGSNVSDDFPVSWMIDHAHTRQTWHVDTVAGWESPLLSSGVMNVLRATATSFGTALAAASVYFGIVFGVGFLLGSIRVPLLVPRLGERYAELAEMPLMFIAMFLAAGYVLSRFSRVRTPGSWLLVGFIALAMLVLAELLLAMVLADRSVGEYIASRDPISGTVYLGMLALFAVMPRLRLSSNGWRRKEAQVKE